MTCDAIPTKLLDLLHDFDLMASPGNARYGGIWKERVNILLTEVEIIQRPYGTFLQGLVCVPEGGSSSMFVHGTFSMKPDTILENVKLVIPWEAKEVPHTFASTMILWQVRDCFHDWRTDDADFIFDDTSKYLPIDKVQDRGSPGGFHIFEPFCGGCGGWTAASRFLRDKFGCDSQIIGLDASFSAVTNYAMNFSCTVIDAWDTLPWDTFLNMRTDCVLHGSVDSQAW